MNRSLKIVKEFFEQKKKQELQKEVLWIIEFDNDIKLLIPAPDTIEGLTRKLDEFNRFPQGIHFDTKPIVQGTVYYTWKRI